MLKALDEIVNGELLIVSFILKFFRKNLSI